MEKYVGYCRTSTGSQSLGLDEQRSRIWEYINSGNHELIHIYTEQESGKNNLRIGLDKAITLCVKNGYTLLFTKLDRLSREVEFLLKFKKPPS